ncbi:MAG: hypothetical protein ACRD0U_04235 [Acidimicrobiales bacterium]
MVLIVVGCGGDGVRAVRTARSDGPQLYEATSVVLESATHGPQLCHTVLDSLPPQCGGIDLIGWNWQSVEGEESVGGTTWGSYHVVGTWDGQQLTLTDAPGPPEAGLPPPVDFTTPCPEPQGGWTAVEPARATDFDLDALAVAARADPGFAGLWLDQSRNPAHADGSTDPSDEPLLNDPTRLIVNIRTTGDIEMVTDTLRHVWGGALCVSGAEHTYAALGAIQTQLTDPEVLSSGLNERDNVVDVTVVVADETTRQQFALRFGNAARVQGWLTEVDARDRKPTSPVPPAYTTSTRAVDTSSQPASVGAVLS